MAKWELNLSLLRSGNSPLFERLAWAISEDIRSGRLENGKRLPGSRTLARSLGIHRNTVLAAYGELEAQGWVDTIPSRGTFVSEGLPQIRRPASAPTADGGSTAGYSVDEPPLPAISPRWPPSVITLRGGMPDLRLIPSEQLARAYRRVVRRRGGTLLGYADPQGHGPLREALCDMLRSTRGLPVGPDDILVTRGSQMALFLAAKALLSPGDGVAIEGLGYPPAWDALRMAGATLFPVPVDSGGLVVEALEELLERQELRAVYLTPHHQYPTMAVLSAPRRLRLLELASKYRFAILEDDYDNEFHYAGSPVLPIASADEGGSVVYIGTLSKVLAPGLRLGYLVAPRTVVRSCTSYRTIVDRQGDQAVEAAVAELLEDGMVQRHVRRMRRTYLSRRDALVAELNSKLNGVLEFELPAGGLSLWSRVVPPVDLDRWLEESVKRGAAFGLGQRYRFDAEKVPFVRLGFAEHSPEELELGVARMAEGLALLK
ncbi:MAG: PLP-dependent aminotransferase family protein [Myxococcales bacterium]|nr:PLP-dependent aminotransferase family protein [Myxococcales bacterium]